MKQCDSAGKWEIYKKTNFKKYTMFVYFNLYKINACTIYF